LCQSLADTGIVEDGTVCGAGALAVSNSTVASGDLNKFVIGDNMENMSWSCALSVDGMKEPSIK
jgi:hypothetical protein